MAADRIGDLSSMEKSSRSARPGFCSDKYSLLVIVGQPGPAGFVDLLVSEIERGKVSCYCGMMIEWDPARASLAHHSLSLHHEERKTAENNVATLPETGGSLFLYHVAGVFIIICINILKYREIQFLV